MAHESAQVTTTKHGFALLKESLPLDLISKHRNALFGIAILWIVLVHSDDFGVWFASLGKQNIFNLIVNYGNVGVDIFLFLSGMGLYFSFRKSDQIRPFIAKRLIRVLPPVLLICGTIWAIRFLIMKPRNTLVFFQDITLMRFWLKGDSQIWYVDFILLLYLVYPIVYHYLFDKGHALALVLLAIGGAYAFNFVLQYAYPQFWSYAEIALTRIPIALFGCYFGKLVYERRKLPTVCSLLVPVGAALVFYLRFFANIHGIGSRTLLGLGGIFFAYLFAIVLELLGTGKSAKVVTKFFEFFGWMSLELYLSHLAMRTVYTVYFMKGKGHIGQYFIFVLIAIVIAALVRLVLDKVPPLFKKIRSSHSDPAPV